jgi:hypothetical protein
MHGEPRGTKGANRHWGPVLAGTNEEGRSILMGRIRTMGLCLAALFAFAAYAASSASALPEVERCIAKTGGKYSEGNCNTKVTKGGSFELSKEIPHPKFTGSSGTAFLETESGTTGKPLPVKEVDEVVATFKGCSLGVAKKNCQTKGDPTGEIVTNTLEGPLGYLSKAKKEVGAELKPHVKKGTFATFECEGFGTILVGEGTGKLGDCIIATVTSPVDTTTTSGSELYTGVKGPEGQEQTPQHFEGKTTHCNLESKIGEGGWERSVQNQEETLTFEEAGEIRA